MHFYDTKLSTVHVKRVEGFKTTNIYFKEDSDTLVASLKGLDIDAGVKGFLSILFIRWHFDSVHIRNLGVHFEIDVADSEENNSWQARAKLKLSGDVHVRMRGKLVTRLV